MDVFTLIIRPVGAVVLMASTTFVLGSVVGYQYHGLILKFVPDNDGDERKYRKLVRWWYTIGVPVSAVVCYFIDDWRTKPIYLLVLSLLVLVFWGLWWVSIEIAMWQRISDLGVRWEFIVSSFSLSLVSAIAGATMVDQAFKWLAWNTTGT